MTVFVDVRDRCAVCKAGYYLCEDCEERVYISSCGRNSEFAESTPPVVCCSFLSYIEVR